MSAYESQVTGLLGEKLCCDVGGRDALVIRGMGARYADLKRPYGQTQWVFEGQEIFRRAVAGMGSASADLLAQHGLSSRQVDLVVPHQANLRIIEAVARRADIPMERVFVNVHRYGNMSAATVPVALVEAIEEGRMKPGSLVLMPAFGAGLTWCAHLLRWGERTSPVATATAELPPSPCSALDIVRDLIARREHAASA